MASSLKVNFWKKKLIGVNVSLTIMNMKSTFLSCRDGWLCSSTLALKK
jgi:hypothetical protein